MPIFLHMVDEHGQPAHADLAGLFIEAIMPNVGILRTNGQIKQAIKDATDSLLREKKQVVILPAFSRVCPKCEQTVTIWNTYTDGKVLCTMCALKPNE